MPELPEVETVRRRLIIPLKGRIIESVDIYYSKYNFLNVLENQKIEDIERCGKFLIFCLSDYYMISHLRMEGKYYIKEENDVGKHDLVRFNLDRKEYLFYNDVRKFGVFYLFKKEEDIFKLEPLKSLGKEPFDLSEDELVNSLKRKTNFIKTSLLDQTIISGLGNIYVDEVLYMSKINPYRESKSITLDEAKTLIRNSVIVLNKSIEKGGSTIKSFASFNGEIGHFQNDLLCHGKEWEKDQTTLGYIIKTRCNGRGTYYSPSLQRLNLNQKLYAITGGFSSGKSEVLRILKEKGEATFSLDEIYKDLLESSKEMNREIKKAFGTNSKTELRKVVFNNKEAIELLNKITHKYIFKELFLRIESSKNAKQIFVEAPLLFEAKLDKCFDKVISVVESDSLRETLLKNKGYTKEEYNLRMQNQLSVKEKSNLSDLIVYNSNTRKDLEKEIDKLLTNL